jgi:hypothetical protein
VQGRKALLAVSMLQETEMRYLIVDTWSGHASLHLVESMPHDPPLYREWRKFKNLMVLR